MVDQSEFGDKQRRALFSSHAMAYGDGRPGYPSKVFDHLRSSCNLGPGCQVLEIGPGAGQATGPLLDAGAEVLAVEVGEEFGSLLRARFEGRSLAVRPGGSVALWWNHFGDPDRLDPFRDAVQPLLHHYAPQFADSVAGGAGIGAHPYALDVGARTEEINSNAEFGPVEHVLIPWTATQTADEIQRFLCSFSSWMALETKVRTDLLQAVGGLIDTGFGGAVERPFLTAVYTAQRL